jgi:hypothetical protein
MVFRLMPPRAAAEGQSASGLWQGQAGVTVSVAEIMARDATFVPPDGVDPNSDRKERKPKLFADRRHLREDPDSAAVAQWPPPVRASADGGGAGTPLEPRSPQLSGVNFLAAQLSESGFIPPDTQAAVGPDQILVVLNGRIKVFDKRGVLGGLNTTTDNFFSSVTTLSTTDPRVRYDRLSGRWFIVMVDIPSSKKNNHVLLAVSSGSVISSGSSFTFFAFQQNSVSPTGDNNLFADYPTLGIDSHALYIGANMFSSSSFSGTTGFVVNKTNLVGGSLTVAAFRRLATATQSGPYTPQGVDNDDSAASEGYFIGVDTRFKGRLVLRRVSNPGGTPSISGNINLSVPTTVSSMGGVPAQGVSTPLDDLDDRLFAARMHKGSLWTAHNIEVDSSGAATSGGGRDGARWYEIVNLTGTPTLRQSGTLFDPASSSPSSYWMPTCAMSGQGHMALGCSVAGTSEYAEIAVAGRFAADPLGTLQSPTVVQTSGSTYDAGSQNPRRWGDYSIVVVDPTDDMTMWTAQEYCNATDSWGVRVIELRAPPPATPTNCSPATAASGATNVAVVLSGSSLNGSGFFDPGVSFPKHISATVNGGGVTVNNVAYSDPTHITLNLSVAAGAAAGSRTITVVNPDGQGITTSASLFAVTGGNSPPVISALASQTINEDTTGGPWDFTVSDAETPSTSLTLTMRSSNTNLVPDSRILVSGSGSARAVSVSPLTNQFGSTTITITVTDGGGASATSAFALTVNPVNDAPSFVKGSDVTVAEDAGPQAIAGWATAIDPGAANESNQALIFIVSSDNPTLFSSPPSISSAGTLTFTVIPNGNGAAVVTAQLFDNGGTANGGLNASAPQSFNITVTPVNDPPTANPQSVVTDEDTQVAIALSGSDVEGDPLTFSLVSTPAHGVLSGSGGGLVYRPNNNYFGSDSFRFKVNDGIADSAPATVAITVNPVNDPPTADDQSVTTAEDTSMAITLTGSDPEGDVLSYEIVTGPVHGALSGAAPSLVYSPDTNFFGTDSIDFKVNDGSLDSATATVTITVNAVNDAPLLDPIADQVITEGITLTLSNTASDVDLPVQTLLFSLDPGAPEGAAIDPTNGVFTWTPTEAQGPGTNLITVRVTDDGSPALSATQRFTVIVLETNTAPALQAIPDQTAYVNRLLLFTVTATDPDFPANQLTFSLGTNAPAAATLDPATGVFEWTPTDTDIGTNVLTVRVIDDGAPPMSDVKSFNVVVVAAPVIQSISVAGDNVTLVWSAVAGRSYQVQFKSDLADPVWGTLAGDVTAAGNTAKKTDVIGSNERRFYQILVMP